MLKVVLVRKDQKGLKGQQEILGLKEQQDLKDLQDHRVLRVI